MRAREFIMEAAYDSMVVSMKQKYPHAAEYIDEWTQWAKATLKKSERVVWFLKILRGQIARTLTPKEIGNYEWIDIRALSMDLMHFYGFNYQPIEDYQYQSKPIGQVIADLTKLEDRWRDAQSKTRGVPVQQGDYKLFEFADGTAWWFVDRAYCPEEGRSGGHCGNVMGKHQPDQRILSLRSKNNQVICTFILEPNGTLGEMKAVNNQKPNERYHPQIVKLLMWDRITGIAPTEYQYNPSANFNVFDLDEKNLAYIDQNKPELIISQIQVRPISALSMPDAFKQKYTEQVTEANPAIGKLLANPDNLMSWGAAIKDDPTLVLYAPEKLHRWEERVIEVITGFEWKYDPKTEDYECVEVNDGVDDESRSTLLMQAPSRISKDPKLVKKMVILDPYILEQVNPNIQDYDSIATIAVRNVSNTLQFVPEEMRTEQLCRRAVEKNGRALRHVPEKLRSREICNLAIQTRGLALEYVPEQFKTPEMCQQAVEDQSRALEFVPDKVRTPELYITAMGEDPSWVITNLPRKLQTPEFFELMITHHPRSLHAIPTEYITPEICEIAVEQSPQTIIDVPKSMQTLELWIKAVEYSPVLMRRVPLEFVDAVAAIVVAKNKR
jgi:hypothetical protein